MTASLAAGTLWLIRHGHTVVHGSGGIAGRSDVPLSDEGREAVRSLGASCSGELRERVLAARWFVSPLGRTRESATILLDTLRRSSPAFSSDARAAATDALPIVDERLVEVDFGDWEGSTWEAVHRDDAAALARWGEDWVRVAPPNGESFSQQTARCAGWYEEHVDRRSSASGRGSDRAEDVVVVAHGGSIRALACRLLGWPLEEAMRLVVDPGATFRLEREGRVEGGWRLAGANLPDFG